MKQTEEIMKNIKKPQTTKDIYAPTISVYNSRMDTSNSYRRERRPEPQMNDWSRKMDIVEKEIKEYNKNKEKNIDKALDMLLYSGGVLRDINNKLGRSLEMYELKRCKEQLINIEYDDDDEDSDYNEILKTVRPYLLNDIEYRISSKMKMLKKGIFL